MFMGKEDNKADLVNKMGSRRKKLNFSGMVCLEIPRCLSKR